MPIEVRDLGYQPLAKSEDDGTTTAVMVPQTEWIATGKEIHDPEFAKLMDGASDAAEEDRCRLEKKFGLDRITAPDGSVETLRLDEIERRKEMGYGVAARNFRMVVPELPWQANMERRYGGRTLIIYRDGRRLVIEENGVRIKQPEEG